MLNIVNRCMSFLFRQGIMRKLPDPIYLKMRYRLALKKSLRLEDPHTFNEKLQWLKLYDRKPIYTTMVDKFAVKQYVAERIGKEYIIPTLGVWDKFDDIDFDALPNQFVLKCTHDSGGLVIVRDKDTMNMGAAKQKIEKSLKDNYYYNGREWPYKDVKPRIIAEQYMTDGGNKLSDYKIHNFNGIPKVILVCRDRFASSGLTEDFFTGTWEHLDIRRPNHPNSTTEIEKPAELDEMLELSRVLSKDIPFLRTDFYTINHKVYFGEMTFYPASGFAGFVPDEWDKTLGGWIKMPIEGGVILYKENIYILISADSDISAKGGELTDYKFFCFNGKVKCFKIDFNRFTNHRANYFTSEGELLPFGEVVCPPDFSRKLAMPHSLKKMIEFSERLSADVPFLRVDFYEVNKQIYFGELTFFPASGFGTFEPDKWDYTLGSWLALPDQT